MMSDTVEPDSSEALLLGELESVLSKLHELHKDTHDCMGPNTLLVGVEFLVSFDVKVLVDNELGSYSYTYAGNQTATTTVGLATRSVAWVDNNILHPSED